MPQPNWTTTEIWQARYEGACLQFKSGVYSPDFFRGVLYRLGFRGQEIESEVNLHWPQRSKGANNGLA